MNKTYTITGRCLDGVKVIAYIIKDTASNEEIKVSKKEVEKLGLNKMILNCTFQHYNGNIVMKGIKCKLTELKSYDKHGNIIEKKDLKRVSHKEYMLEQRIVRGKNTLGYVISKTFIDGTKKYAKVTKENIIDLVKDGRIVNARVQNFNGKVVLRGVGCNILELPIMRLAAI